MGVAETIIYLLMLYRLKFYEYKGNAFKSNDNELIVSLYLISNLLTGKILPGRGEQELHHRSPHVSSQLHLSKYCQNFGVMSG